MGEGRGSRYWVGMRACNSVCVCVRVRACVRKQVDRCMAVGVDWQSMRTYAIEKSSRTCNRTPGTWPKSAVRSKKKAEKRESIEGTTRVLLGRFVSGLRVLVFLLFLEQKCSLKNTRASISRISSDELSISTFFPPYSKAWKTRPAPLEFCGTFKRKLQPDASDVGRAVSKRIK